MSQEEKEHKLRKIYFNEDGSGSINETYKEAEKQLNSLNIEDVKKMVRTTKEKTKQTV